MSDDLNNILESLMSAELPVSELPVEVLSDLGREGQSFLSRKWSLIPRERRAELIQELGDREALQFDLDFSSVHFIGIRDNNPEVISSSIRNLAGLDNPHTLPDLLELISHENPSVRYEAASAMGYFIYLGELDEIPEDLAKRTLDTLLQVHRNDSDARIRCAALESLGYSEYGDIPDLILRALNSDDLAQSLSAMRAIGRSADPDWEPSVLKYLHNLHPEMRLEAVRAAGELELKATLQDLVELLDDVDRTIRLAAIWSIAQIGGEEVEDLLAHLLEANEDVEEIDLIEDALSLVEFNKGIDDMLLLNLDPDNPGQAQI